MKTPFQAARSFALLGFLLAGGAAAQSWQGSATLGVAVSDGRGRNLAGARVEIRHRDGGDRGPGAVLTDSSGRAAFTGLAAGAWSLDISHPDHLSYVAVLSLRPGKKPEVTASFLQATGSGRDSLRVKLSRARTPIGVPAAPAPATAAPPAPQPTPISPDEAPTAVAAAEPAPAAGGETQAATAAPEPPPPGQEPRPETPETARPEPTPDPVTPEVVARTPPQPVDVAEEPPAAAAPPAAPEPAVAEAAPSPAPPPVSEPVPTPPPAPMPPPIEPTVEPQPAPAAAEPAYVEARPVEPETVASPPPAPAEAPQPRQPEPATAPPSSATAESPAVTPPPQPVPQPSAPPDQQLPEPAVSPELPSPAPEAPPERATLRPAAPPLRSFSNRSCVECKPGEWAVTAEAVLPAGDGCAAAPLPELEPTFRVLADAAAADLSRFAGQAVGSTRPTALEMVEPGVRSRIADGLDGYSGEDSACRVVAAALPAGARFVGFRFEAAEGSRVADCLAAQDCPIGDASWQYDPRIVRGSALTVIYSVFENRSAGSSRTGRLIVYFEPPPGWQASR